MELLIFITADSFLRHSIRRDLPISYILSHPSHTSCDLITASVIHGNLEIQLVIILGKLLQLADALLDIRRKGRKMLNAVSIAKGSLNCYNKYVKGILPTREERKAIKKDFLNKLDGIDAFECKKQYKLICGVGGTVRAALKLDKLFFGTPEKENVLQVSHIGYIINAMVQKENKDKFLKNMSLLMDVVPERIRTILPGMIILYAVAKRFKCEAVVVAHTGVREGFMYSHVLNGLQDGQDKINDEIANDKQMDTENAESKAQEANSTNE